MFFLRESITLNNILCLFGGLFGFRNRINVVVAPAQINEKLLNN